MMVGVPGDTVLVEQGNRITSAAEGVLLDLGVPCDSASLLIGLNTLHYTMSSRMRCCRSGLPKKCCFSVASLRIVLFQGKLYRLRT